MVLWQRYFYVCNINLDTSQSSDLKLSLIKNRTMPAISFLKLLWKCQCKITQLYVQYCRPSVICVLVCLKHARQNLFLFFLCIERIISKQCTFSSNCFFKYAKLTKKFLVLFKKQLCVFDSDNNCSTTNQLDIRRGGRRNFVYIFCSSLL